MYLSINLSTYKTFCTIFSKHNVQVFLTINLVVVFTTGSITGPSLAADWLVGNQLASHWSSPRLERVEAEIKEFFFLSTGNHLRGVTNLSRVNLSIHGSMGDNKFMVIKAFILYFVCVLQIIIGISIFSIYKYVHIFL